MAQKDILAVAKEWVQRDVDMVQVADAVRTATYVYATLTTARLRLRRYLGKTQPWTRYIPVDGINLMLKQCLPDTWMIDDEPAADPNAEPGVRTFVLQESFAGTFVAVSAGDHHTHEYTGQHTDTVFNSWTHRPDMRVISSSTLMLIFEKAAEQVLIDLAFALINLYFSPAFQSTLRADQYLFFDILPRSTKKGGHPVDSLPSVEYVAEQVEASYRAYHSIFHGMLALNGIYISPSGY